MQKSIIEFKVLKISRNTLFKGCVGGQWSQVDWHTGFGHTGLQEWALDTQWIDCKRVRVKEGEKGH